MKRVLFVLLFVASILLVPFAGSGSECVAAKKLGIHFIAFEINPTYIELCNTRLNDD